MTSAMSNTPEREALREILSKDNGELVSLSDIRSFRAWDYSWPTLTKPHRFTARHTYASDEAMISAIKTHNHGVTHSLLEAVGAMKDDNTVVLYGGALVDLVLKNDGRIKDWDLRLVGKEFVGDEHKCVQAAKDFVDSIFAWLKEENSRVQIQNQLLKETGKVEEPLFDVNAVKVTRSMSTISVVVPCRDVRRYPLETVLQFTFNPFASVEDLFRHSYPQCTCIAVQNGKVVLDQAARYCLESVCVVLDASRFVHCRVDDEGPVHSRSITTEIQRLIRYFDKGFDIILPDLDMTKVPTRNLKFEQNEVLDLPLLTVIYDGVEKNKIMTDNLLSVVNGEMGVNTAGRDGYADGAEINAGTSIHHNIRCLVADVYDQFQYATEGEEVSPIFDFCPLLTPRAIDKSYETVKDQISGDLIHTNAVVQYFAATSPTEVLEEIVIKPIRSMKREAGSLPELFQFDEAALDQIIAKEKDAIIEKLQKVREKMLEQGLDKLVIEFPTEVTSKERVKKALYGEYLLADHA